MVALTADVRRTFGKIRWHKKANLYYSCQTSEHERMSEHSVNLHERIHKMKWLAKRKASTLTESISAWSCPVMAHPVRKILEVNELDNLPRRRGNILTLLPEQHCAVDCN